MSTEINMTTQSLKVERLPGVPKLAPANIEAHTVETALLAEAYAFDMQMLDLKNEMVQRESKLRAGFLARVAAITAEAVE